MSLDPAPIPIAFCITELDRGGAEKALVSLVTGLSRDRWRPHVYCLGPRGYFVEVLESRGIPVTCYGGRGVFSVLVVLARLTWALMRTRPALVQTFLFHANLIGRIAAKLARIPIVVSGIRVAERRSRWYGRIDFWTNALVTQNVCVSEGVAEFSVHDTGLKREKLTVIPNGVEFDAFANAIPADISKLGIRAGQTVIISVGRLEPQKGIHDLLRAAGIVLSARPDCHFLIVGEGKDRKSLEALAGSLGVSQAVTFTGAQSDVAGLLKASDVFVLASLWEGMPNALLEAMAAGLPVVATAVEGTREIVISGESGMLVPPGDPAAIANALLTILEDPGLAGRFVKRSQDTLRKNFTTAAAVASYERLYFRLMVN